MSTHVVNTHEAKSRLSELIREAEAGVEVIVARNGRPVARIVAWQAASSARVPGAWSGRVAYSEDVVGSDADTMALFDESSAADAL
ncbi:type II toxin-antitoxin system prevent-host-death family antitoxin [Acidimicrobium ferrooxidans]|uniref:Antitoxin n=1 Tax=Acidimicrobium ferrooxidans TaxID=53635 RepID=A0ABS3APX0_9ACTN|nr:type II toxin-antitoxin system prevent-host-death family antitoxin [Acidimicrobium ferrooxidans]